MTIDESIAPQPSGSDREAVGVPEAGKDSGSAPSRGSIAKDPPSAPTTTAPQVGVAQTAYPGRRIPGPLLVWFEYWYARRTSRRLLALYYHVHEELPSATGRVLYEEVVIRWTGADRRSARSTLDRAAQSFVDWNSDRELRFRDVALFLIVHEYMKARPERHGVVARMGGAVARIVPVNL